MCSRVEVSTKRRQSTFRLFAALGLLFALLGGVAALTLAGLMALRKLGEFLLPELGMRQLRIPGVSDLVTWFIIQVTASPILLLTTSGVALLGLAMILRQIVLWGLRD